MCSGLAALRHDKFILLLVALILPVDLDGIDKALLLALADTVRYGCTHH